MESTGLTAFPNQHNFISLRIDTHGQMGRFAIFRLWIASYLAASSFDLSRSGNDIGHLETHARPRAPAFAATMDANDRSANFDFTDDFILFEDFASEDIAIETDGSIHIRGPDDIFDAFYIHAVP